MARYWKRNSIWITGLSAFFLLIALSIALGWNPVDAMLSSATVSAKDVDATAQADATKRVQVATLKPVSATLSQLVFTAESDKATPDAKNRLVEADALRKTASPAEAIRAYILLLDEFPNTPQAKVADERFHYLLEGRTEAEMNAIEAALPSPKELADVDGITAIAQFYFRRAMDAGEENPEEAAPYLQAIYEIGLPVFEGNLDDGYKTTLLNGYLQVADALEKGKEAREALTKLASTLPPCFTSWLIRTEVMGQEPPFEFVQTEQGQAAVRKYYMDKAKDSKDPAVSTAYRAKSRDIAWQSFTQQPPDVPRLDDVLNYLQAANTLGKSELSGTETGRYEYSTSRS